jgi:predicted amidohydrolase YtcJ
VTTWPAAPRPVVLRDVVVVGRSGDVRLADGRIESVAPSIRPTPADLVIDAAGRWLHVGLHDHHLHLRAMAAAGRSVTAGPPKVNDPAALRAALVGAVSVAPPGAWLRAVGYHESVAGPLRRQDLDQLVADHPLRVQHRSGELWMLNSAAVEHLEVAGDAPPGVERAADGRPTGRFWRLDRWLAGRWPAPPRAGLSDLSVRAARRGVTGWTDATPDRNDAEEAALAAAVEDGTVVQRLHLMVRPGAPATDGRRPGRCTRGPVKVLLDDTGLPTLDELVALIEGEHRGGRSVAIHCVTRVQAVLAVAALDAAGASGADRMEHGAIIPAELLDDLRRLGVTVVTQPNFVAERGDAYVDEVAPQDRPDLWRARSLLTGSIGVAIGTDAPFGDDDPWVAVRAAADRTTPSGRAVGPEEAVDVGTALEWLSGRPSAPCRTRRIEVGEPADLILLDASPDDAAGPIAPGVAATVIAGVVVHGQELLC